MFGKSIRQPVRVDVTFMGPTNSRRNGERHGAKTRDTSAARSRSEHFARGWRSVRLQDTDDTDTNISGRTACMRRIRPEYNDCRAALSIRRSQESSVLSVVQGTRIVQLIQEGFI